MSIFSGWFGEKTATFNMWLNLDSSVYRRYHNVIVPSETGTSQIDHLLVSQYGIFIVETKNISGWIFGSENQSTWRQVLYRKKYSFQNPVRQTFRQKIVLSVFLGIEESKIHTVIYFAGDCKFKTNLPQNVIKSKLSRYIKRYREKLFFDSEVDSINRKVMKLKSEKLYSNRDHVESLRRRHGSNTICPRCGSNLVERTVRNGPRAGSRFLGCGGYPKCRFTKNIT